MPVIVILLLFYTLKIHDTHCIGDLVKDMASMKKIDGKKTHFVNRGSNPKTSSLTVQAYIIPAS
jgi:hypothetical protein